MIILQSDVGRELSALELDENFRTLDSPPVEIIDTGENTYTPDMDAPGNVFKYTITEATTIDPPLKVKVGTYGFLVIWQDDLGGHEYEFSKAAYWVVGSKEVPSRRPSSLSIFRYNVVEEDVIIIELLYTDPKVIFWDGIVVDEDVSFDSSNMKTIANIVSLDENGEARIFDEFALLNNTNMRSAANMLAVSLDVTEPFSVFDEFALLNSSNMRAAAP